MRLIHYEAGILEIRWTWLPYWIAASPKIKTELEREMRDLALINGITNSDEDLDTLHGFVAAKIAKMFPAFTGLGDYLAHLRIISVENS